jgi:hypothetical protein
MTNEKKAKMIADQCKPCTKDFYSGIYQGVLLALNAEDNAPQKIAPFYPKFEVVKIIAGACLKHADSGEGSYNKEARVILMELENNGYKIVKK